MQGKVVSLSPRGQLVIPAAMLRAMGIRGRTDVALVQEGGSIPFMRATDLGKRAVDDLAGFDALAASSFAAMWDNAADEVWNHP
ncbi:MAG: AbrB/MazE/SpoVT family DNA-binding domain-containing protein [Thermoplasmatota archaeon]